MRKSSSIIDSAISVGIVTRQSRPQQREEEQDELRMRYGICSWSEKNRANDWSGTAVTLVLQVVGYLAPRLTW